MGKRQSDAQGPKDQGWGSSRKQLAIMSLSLTDPIPFRRRTMSQFLAYPEGKRTSHARADRFAPPGPLIGGRHLNGMHVILT